MARIINFSDCCNYTTLILLFGPEKSKSNRYCSKCNKACYIGKTKEIII